VLAAKMLATVDLLSKGRLTVGVGVGWMAEEIALLGGPDFRARGRASDEYVQAMRALWTEPSPSFQGEHVGFDGLLFRPQPADGGLPVWVGGEAPGARRRAGRLGDGWYPVAANPRHPLDTQALYGEALAHVRREAEAAGRDPAAVTPALLAISCRIGPEQEGRDGGRKPFTGSAAAIVDDIAGFRKAGLAHFLIGGDGGGLAETADRLDAFSSEVIAKLV